MKITQISIFLENRKGRLSEVVDVLGSNSINVRALTVAETENFGVLRIVVDKPDKAIETLKNNGFVASTTDVVAVEVADEPGALASLLKIIDKSELNVEYMYGFVEKKVDRAMMIFRFDDAHKAAEFLASSGIKVVGESDIEDV